MRSRRKRLFVRQSLAYREGKHPDPSWSVGYWDAFSKHLHADQAFRVLTSKPSEKEAAEAADQIAKKQKHLYIF